MQKKSHIDVGTIGARPCEVALNSILMTVDDAKVVRKVMNRINDLRFGLSQLQHVPDLRCRKMFITDFYDRIRDGVPDDLPPNVYTHTLCCLAAIYRTELKRAGQQGEFAVESRPC